VLAGATSGRDPRRDAHAIYLLTMAALHEHLRRRTVPVQEEVEHLAAFALAGAGILR
jgi:hypothetical protein